MKRYLITAVLVLAALLLGLLLGGRGGAWQDLASLQGWLTGKPTVSALDPAMSAGLPQPDRSSGLPDGPLNALLKPGLTPQQQTGIIGQLLLDYHLNTGSLPNGTWEEIVEQLAGKNRTHLTLVPKEHPAMSQGAFRTEPGAPGIHLHVVSSSGGAFQLLYEGPDGKPYTKDDEVRSFPPELDKAGFLPGN